MKQFFFQKSHHRSMQYPLFHMYKNDIQNTQKLWRLQNICDGNIDIQY